MRRLQHILSAAIVSASLVPFIGCGSSVPPTPGFGVPSVIRLQPAPTASLDLGSTTQFSASALSGARTPLSTTFSYSTSNPNVVSIANNGLVCAGTWDNVAAPVVCTPGGVGRAQVTASAAGVTSAPTTVYVHQPIAQIRVAAIPLQTPPFVDPTLNCYTSLAGSAITPHSQDYQASALADDATGHPTVDITPSVGPFSWAESQPSVATLTTLSSFGLPNGQVQLAAHTPGMTQIFASIANTTSGPVSFTTCPVQSISLAVNGTGGNTIAGNKGTSSSVAATVSDIAGNLIAPTLTWSSSASAVAAVSTAGGVTSPGAGGASITASCIAPTCNVNLSPPQSIYPPTPISATYTSTTATAFNVFVASSNATCAANVNCVASLVPISGTPPVAGTAAPLPSVPNSMQFLPSGGTAFMGSQKGLMAVTAAATPPTTKSSPTVTGKVLAVSPDGKKVIVSDTSSPVNQVFIFDTTASTSTNLLISGATAAAFSPDSLKAFILAATVAQNVVTTTLYVYSTQSALQTIQLTTGTPAPPPPMDAAFLANGMFGYASAGNLGTFDLATCDDPTQPLAPQVQSVGASISSIRPLPDGSGFVGLAVPNLAFINTAINGFPLSSGQSGCPAPFQHPPGVLTATNTVTSVPLSGSAFTPVAFLLSSDAQKIYIVVQNSTTIIVFDVLRRVQSALTLVGNLNPLAAALAPDGQTLYVSGTDSKVHFVNTVSGGDVYQVGVLPSTLCTITTGGTQPPCLPDLLAVRP